MTVRSLSRVLILAAGLLLSLSLNAAGYRLLQLDGYMVKWGDHTLGQGARVSYAFAQEPLQFEGARNCGDLKPLHGLAGPDLPLDVLVQEAEAAFRVWERAANLSFYRVDDAREADIVLGAQGQPSMWAFANVAYGPESRQGVRVIERALVCLNPQRPWKVGFDGNSSVYDLRYTLIHEIGHAIGLDHPGPSGALMGFRYTESFAGLQPGDLRGVQHLYGPAGNEVDVAEASVLLVPDAPDRTQ
jgi:hypothetical protein